MSLFRSLLGASVSLERSLIVLQARRSIRFRDYGDGFKGRAKDREASHLQRRFPRHGPLHKLPPETPLYKVKLLRSPRGLSKKIRLTAQTLGFGNDAKLPFGITRNQTVWVPQTPIFAGRILKIKELVRVRLVTEAQRLEELAFKAGSRERMKGYEVIGRAEDMTDI